jgi:hypothetical protein
VSHCGSKRKRIKARSRSEGQVIDQTEIDRHFLSLTANDVEPRRPQWLHHTNGGQCKLTRARYPRGQRRFLRVSGGKDAAACVSHFLSVDRVHLFNTFWQIEEKYWAHRRGSETASEGTASFVGSFRLTSLHSPAPPGEFPSGSDPFVEEEDEKHIKEEVLAPGTCACALLQPTYLIA